MPSRRLPTSLASRFLRSPSTGLGGLEAGIIAGISDPALHAPVLARFPQRQFERGPIACHQGHSPANAAAGDVGDLVPSSK